MVNISICVRTLATIALFCIIGAYPLAVMTDDFRWLLLLFVGLVIPFLMAIWLI